MMATKGGSFSPRCVAAGTSRAMGCVLTLVSLIRLGCIRLGAQGSALVNGRVHDGFLARIAGGEFLDDTAALRHQYPVREIQDLRQVGGNQQDAQPLVGEPLDELMD